VDIYGEPDGKLGALQVAIGDGVAAVTWTEDDYAQGTFAVSLDDEPRMVWQRAGFWKLGGSSDALVGFRDDPDEEYPLTGVAPGRRP
jgi:hypothetical protein